MISHPVLATIGRDEIQRAIPESQRVNGWDHVEIVPFRRNLGALHNVNWAEAAANQERLFAELLQGKMANRQRLAYFGFAPIPLALHLGYRVERGIKVDVYQRHHVREDWVWSSDDSLPACSLLRPLNLPDHGSTDKGPVVIRVSTSHRIAPQDTAAVVPRSLAEIDVALVDTGEDALDTRGALAEVVNAFNQALSKLNGLFPNLTTFHVFAAIPVGLAFRLGTQINPTIYRSVVTYQYWARGSPRYRRAIVLIEGRGMVFPDKSPLPANNPEDDPDIDCCPFGPVSPEIAEASISVEHFLNQETYKWDNTDAREFHEIMAAAYKTPSRAECVLSKSGVDNTSINFNQAPIDYWKEALEAAVAAGRLRALATNACNDARIGAYHSRLRRIIA